MIQIGDVTITPVFEVQAGRVIQECISAATPDAVRKIDWLAPNYITPDGLLNAQVQALVLDINGKKVLVDSCVGNGRNRPELPAWANLQTDFLDRLTGIVRPEAVDYVLCTHLHFDHVGWNTVCIDNVWTPTFPNAQYIFCQKEFDYWNGNPTGEVVDDINGFAESVLPIYRSGQAKLVLPNHQVMDGISLFPTPGHTPGHVSVLIESNGASAVITGDVFHHPCQIAHPEWKTFDTDSELANDTRKQLLERFADTDTVFIGSHFAEPIAGTVTRDGSSYKLMSIL